MIIVLALLLGCASAVDMPVRQSFAIEMVGPRDIGNAVAINSAMFNGARVVGPAMAGLTIAAFGIAPAFAINAVSFLAVIIALGGHARRRAAPAASGAPTEVGRCGRRDPARGPRLRPPHAHRVDGRDDGRAGRHVRHELPGAHPAARPGRARQRRLGLRLPDDRVRHRCAGVGGRAGDRRSTSPDPHRARRGRARHRDGRPGGLDVVPAVAAADGPDRGRRHRHGRRPPTPRSSWPCPMGCAVG